MADGAPELEPAPLGPHVTVSTDYSELELRVMSQMPELAQKAFELGVDPYAYAANSIRAEQDGRPKNRENIKLCAFRLFYTPASPFIVRGKKK